MPVDGRPPGTTFLGQTFGEMCAAATPLPVTIRLLDVAADKIPQWMSSIAAVGGALGLQGVRLFDREPARGVIHAQLAAIDQLSEQFELRILIPYLVRYEEVRHWVDTIRSRLSRPVPIGAMIETPAGALDLAHWLDAVDFVAVGCNDLMQCLFAADRDRPELRHYLDPYAPLLFRFFRQLADAAGKRLEQVQLCGLLPQIQGVMPILLGLGYRTFSVEPTLIPHLAATVTATTITDARLLAERACAAAETRQVVELLELHTGKSPPYGVRSD
jgi:phosphoenolpyruvate-protein kinase (PTS system EI component)